MRLLNVQTLALEEFHENTPPYAILSHTWESGEVLFQDLWHGTRSTLPEKRGYQKIIMSCKLAREDDIPYIWIDTCCINRESSAELSEAINSMYRYYRDSVVCYAYLADVHRDGRRRNFLLCKWFTRGWTLQELLAPSSIIFLDADWVELGTKSSLQEYIVTETGIPMTGLLNFDPGMFSIAQRMSWASQRQTTREEDQAYCLMGILDVHMPVLYGEGRTNAFRRLQLEIIKHSNDQSIFAWSMPVGSSEPRGLLARSPSEFRASRKARVAMNILANSFIGTNTRSFSMTNNGLRISLPMEAVPGEDGVFLAYLDCQPEDGDGFLGIFLKKIDQEQQYVRWRADEVGLYSAWSALRAVMQEVFVRDPPSSPQQTTSPGVLYHIKISREFAFLTRFRFSAVSEDLTELPRENIVSTAVAVPDQDLEALKIQHTPSKISFLVIAGVDKHRFFLDLVTEFSNEESMKDLLQSYSGSSSSRSSIRTQFLDRLVKIVPGTQDAIHIGIRTTRRKMHCLNISVIPASHLGFRISLSQAKPTLGLMIRTFETLESGFELEEVIVTKSTSRENFENSVIHLTFRDEEPITILVFEKYGGQSRGFQQIAIILGIHLNHAWADVVHVSSSIFDEGETMEKILRSYEKEEVERRQWQQSVSRVVDTGDSAWVGRFTVEVTTGMNKKLQLGTHWAAIRILRSQS